jgi:hypothetical protein
MKVSIAVVVIVKGEEFAIDFIIDPRKNMFLDNHLFLKALKSNSTPSINPRTLIISGITFMASMK